MFGAQAVNLHGFPRATADLDLTVELARRTPRSFLVALRKAGFDARFADDAFIAAMRVIPVVHRATKLPVDLVLAGPGLEEQFLDEVELRPLGRRTIPVLSAENLIVTKLLAGRPKDLEDVRELLAVKGSALDAARVEEVLRALEEALARNDLVPAFRRLRDTAGEL